MLALFEWARNGRRFALISWPCRIVIRARDGVFQAERRGRSQVSTVCWADEPELAESQPWQALSRLSES